MATKACSRCDKRKAIPSGFYRNGETVVPRTGQIVDRFRPECKACTDEARRKKARGSRRQKP